MRICDIENCNRKHFARGYCRLHYDRWLHHGNPHTLLNCPDGKGTISHGYRIITVNGKYVPEHRHIMEQYLKRKLKPWPEEVVHHKNGIKDDNRIENLEVMSLTKHNSLHSLKSIIVDNKKLCTICNKYKSLSEFSPSQHTISKLRSNCKKCAHIKLSKNP